jgi:hypothetical protein
MALLLDPCAAALNQNHQNNKSQNAGYNSDEYGAVHFESPFLKKNFNRNEPCSTARFTKPRQTPGPGMEFRQSEFQAKAWLIEPRCWAAISGRECGGAESKSPEQQKPERRIQP